MVGDAALKIIGAEGVEGVSSREHMPTEVSLCGALTENGLAVEFFINAVLRKGNIYFERRVGSLRAVVVYKLKASRINLGDFIGYFGLQARFLVDICTGSTKLAYIQNTADITRIVI